MARVPLWPCRNHNSQRFVVENEPHEVVFDCFSSIKTCSKNTYIIPLTNCITTFARTNFLALHLLCALARLCQFIVFVYVHSGISQPTSVCNVNVLHLQCS